MKIKKFPKLLASLVITGLTLGVSVASAQNSPAANDNPAATANSTVPQLSYGVPQILQLVNAKVGDGTIIAYIKNSGNSYGLDADQIIYLRQQGVSDAVITAMLNQPKPAAFPSAPTPAPQPAAATAAATVPTGTVAPTVTYVQTVPATTYYYSQPYYYPYYYSYFPAVSLSFGWGGSYSSCYRGGYYGGYHGGYSGGWHGGGGWHH